VQTTQTTQTTADASDPSRFPKRPKPKEDTRPKTHPYHRGDPIPPGYQKVVSGDGPLIAQGLKIFVASHAPTLLLAALTKEPKVIIPVVGPVLLFKPLPKGSNAGAAASIYTILAIDSICQLVGVASIIYGLTTIKTELRRSDLVAFKPEFSVGPGSIQMRMRF
jgi:hypothetical protein